ncbi:N-acetylglucosamine-6-phosphate deacetylase [Planococcus halotolerans]|uniref:N-acetylglucosamine-6-phosphate deacetylase n=2 Tax=Planococcus halotolerans TaxID=2233542 RepID=A0A365KWS2_9BACL|nr:N-acetylglucosamine-6-phosphate deacetylase [Planococcus halotolerans]QHJ69161.1 N-acetylglucosamine-6-phosphate deacetylase [Planococcus halotolerans]RAZ77636.1 N-acetylglucosamine-6-phosphate deacetylase [Planococcus halotolerans]
MSRMLIKNIRLVQPEGELADGTILIENGRIISASTEPIDDWSGECFDGGGSVALPGFIDIHIHGAAGADFMDDDSTAAGKVAAALPAEGTTSFLATTLTQSPERISSSIHYGRTYMKGSGEGAAEMLGFHLEGPFIHPDQAGAQPSAYICEPSMDQMYEWFGDTLADLKIITMAPEQDKNFKITHELNERGVIVSAGHTTADYKTLSEAQAAGLSHLTHYGNAMRGLHHREIGVVGAGMLNKELFCEIIADGIHLSPDMLKLVVQVIGPERLLLITDSMRAKGLPDGSYTLGDQKVTVSGNEAILADGTLAGSMLKMNEGLRQLKDIADITWTDAIALSSGNAARRLGVFDRKGSIERGKDADIVLVTEDFNVQYTFCRGKMSFAHDSTGRRKMNLDM